MTKNSTRDDTEVSNSDLFSTVNLDVGEFESYVKHIRVGKVIAQKLGIELRKQSHIIDEEDLKRVEHQLRLVQAQLNIIAYHLPCPNPDKAGANVEAELLAAETHQSAIEMIENQFLILQSEASDDDRISNEQLHQLDSPFTKSDKAIEEVVSTIPWLNVRVGKQESETPL